MAEVNLDVSQSLDITCVQGDTFSLNLTLKNSSGTGIDITNYAFYMQVYESAFKGRRLIISTTNTSNTRTQKITKGNIVITADADQTTNPGLFNISIGSEVMKTMTPGSYDYEIQFNTTGDSSGTDTTFLKGVMTVLSDLTKIDDR